MFGNPTFPALLLALLLVQCGVWGADIEMKVVLFNNVHHYMTATDTGHNAECTVRHRVDIRELYLKYHSTLCDTVNSAYMTWHVWFVHSLVLCFWLF